MTDRCLEHDLPLAQEHTSKKLIRLPCYFARQRANRNTLPNTDPRTRRKEAQRRTYQKKKVTG